MKLSDKEAYHFLGTIFPGGLKDSALIAELCPHGWEESPLFACFHPSQEHLYREYLDFFRNLQSLNSRMKKRVADDAEVPMQKSPISYEEFVAKYPEESHELGDKDHIEEPANLIGLCLWDVFSENHEVVAADGRVVDLGSFRGTAEMISDFFEAVSIEAVHEDDWWDARGYGYMDFYMGTSWVKGRADLTPVYELIFRRLHAIGANWRYSFPQIQIVDFGPGEVQSDLPYDPSAALQREAQRKARAEETAKIRRGLERNLELAKRKARTGAPPPTVSAYQKVFHRFPTGWPPDPYTPV
jgi:hypothetical protein